MIDILALWVGRAWLVFGGIMIGCELVTWCVNRLIVHAKLYGSLVEFFWERARKARAESERKAGA